MYTHMFLDCFEIVNDRRRKKRYINNKAETCRIFIYVIFILKWITFERVYRANWRARYTRKPHVPLAHRSQIVFKSVDFRALRSPIGTRCDFTCYANWSGDNWSPHSQRRCVCVCVWPRAALVVLLPFMPLSTYRGRGRGKPFEYVHFDLAGRDK